MGRIKTTFVKNIARELMEGHPESFTGSFDENKRALAPFISFSSGKMRNLVAGYITSVKNVKPYAQTVWTEERSKDDRFGRRAKRRVAGRR